MKKKLILIPVMIIVAILAVVIVLQKGGGVSAEEEATTATETTTALAELTEAPYEHWLAAALMGGVSMYYPDFSEEVIYASGSTALENGTDSDGIYLTFVSEDVTYTIHAYPLTGERQQSGTMDIYSETLGYAAFDVTEGDEVPAGYSQLTIDNLNELISESVRITIFEH